MQSDGKKCNSNQKWNGDKYQCECKKYYWYKKDYVWNLSTCTCEIDMYLKSILDGSIFVCDEIKDVTNTI